MNTLTEVVHSPDTSITKTEVFDVAFARQLMEDTRIPIDDRKALKRYVKNSKVDKHLTHYQLGREQKEDTLGRWCAVKSEGLQCFPREVRNALAREYYWDLDFVNAQPTILKQYADTHGWITTALTKYNDQREEMLTSICKLMGIERWEAKEKVISIVFGCGAGLVAGMPPFFEEEFYPEIRKIMENNWKHNEKALKKYNKRPNRVATGLALILQTEERKCLMALDTLLLKHQRNLDVYIHDGGLVRKKEGEKVFPSSLIAELEKGIKELTGYSLRLSVKEMETNFEKIVEEDDYPEMKEEFEKTHFKMELPYGFVRMDGKELHTYNLTELKGVYANKFLSDGSLFIDRWLNDPELRTYKSFVYRPKQEVPADRFNLFTGFDVEPVEGDVSVIRDVLRLISGNDPAMMEYIEKWTAWLVQRPYEKLGTCIVISGEQGVGKDTYWDFICELLGTQYTLITSRPDRDIHDKFNGHLKKVILIKCEEAQYLINKDNGESMKNLITQTKQVFQDKGAKSITLDCFFNFVMTTNQTIPVPLEQTDRRYALCYASSEKRGDVAYWNNVYSTLAKPETRSAYMDYLLKIDLTGFVPSQYPRTEYLEEVKETFIPYHALWFQGFIAREGEEGLEQERTFTATELLRRMNENTKFETTATKLGRDIKHHYQGVIQKQKGKLMNSYTFKNADLLQFLKQKKWWADI